VTLLCVLNAMLAQLRARDLRRVRRSCTLVARRTQSNDILAWLAVLNAMHKPPWRWRCHVGGHGIWTEGNKGNEARGMPKMPAASSRPSLSLLPSVSIVLPVDKVSLTFLIVLNIVLEQRGTRDLRSVRRFLHDSSMGNRPKLCAAESSRAGLGARRSTKWPMAGQMFLEMSGDWTSRR